MNETILSHVMERSALIGPDAAQLALYYIGEQSRFATCSGVGWFPGPYLAAVNLYGGHLRIYRIDQEDAGAPPRLELLHEIADAFGQSEDVAVAPDGAWLAVTRVLSGRFLVTLYPVDPVTMAPGDGIDIAEDTGPFHGICFSPDGRYLGFTNIGTPGYVDIVALRPAGAERTCRLENTHMPLRPKGISFSPDGRFVAISTAQNASPEPNANGAGGLLAVHRFDGASGVVTAEPVAQFGGGPLEYCEMCTFLPGDPGDSYRILVAMQAGGSVVAYDFDAKDRILTSAGVFAAGTPFPHGIRSSPDGRLVAVACYGDDALRIIRNGPEAPARARAPQSATRNRKVIYTVVTGTFDDLKPPAIVEPDIDYIVYTDVSGARFPAPWQAHPIRRTERNPRVTARWHKILAHYHLDRYDYSFWIDANYEIVGAFSPLFDRLAATTCLATHKHPVRDCAYAEAEEIKGAGMERCEIVDLQMEYYRSLGFPARSGLIESGVLFRAHNDSRVEAMMRDWWDQVDTFSQRDQLSANYVFWKHRFAYDELPWPSRASEYLRYHPHPRTANYIEAESVAKALERLRDAGQDRRRPRVAESRQAL